MPGKGIDADAGDEALVDLQAVHLELAQVGQAGMSGAEIVDGDLHSQGMQFVEQAVGDFARLDQLALGQFQDQGDVPGRKRRQQLATVVHQGQFVAMGGTDVETDVEAWLQLPGMPAQVFRDLAHQRARHRYDQSRALGERYEQVGPDQSLTRMTPAHEHLDAYPASALAGTQRLVVGNELVGLQGPAQFAAGRGDPPG